MVTVEGGAVKSSHGRPPLVDGVLERLTATPALKELAARSEGRFKPRGLAALVTLGFYLGRPTRKPVDLTLTEMLDLAGGIGWELARAAVSAWNPRHDGPPDPAPEDPEYRHTVMQSQVHRRLLARAVEQLDVHELARFYGHLSRRYLATRMREVRRTAHGCGVRWAAMHAVGDALGRPCTPAGGIGLPCTPAETQGRHARPRETHWACHARPRETHWACHARRGRRIGPAMHARGRRIGLAMHARGNALGRRTPEGDALDLRRTPRGAAR